MGELEIRIVAEGTGNYNEDDVEEIIDTYNTLKKHIGFVDDRKDNRYVVKFHDIFYYMPEEYEKEHSKEIESLFDDFCWMTSENITDNVDQTKIAIDDMLHPMYVGNYQVFIVDIPEITEDNISELAMRVFDEFPYDHDKYIENYIQVVNNLKDLEDNYMEYWIDFLKDDGTMPKDVIKEIEERYHKDIERRKAK